MSRIKDIILVLRVLSDICMRNARNGAPGRSVTTDTLRVHLMDYLVQEVTPGGSIGRAIEDRDPELTRRRDDLAWELAGELVLAAADLGFLRLVEIVPETIRVEWTELGARTHYQWEGRSLDIARIELAMTESDADDWVTACVEAQNADEGVQMFPDELVVA